MPHLYQPGYSDEDRNNDVEMQSIDQNHGREDSEVNFTHNMGFIF